MNNKHRVTVEGKGYERREFIIEFNCKTEAEFFKIVKDSIHQVVNDEFCKVRFIITDKKWNNIKKSISKHVMVEYKELIKNFFFEGKVPDKSEYDLSALVARSYEEESEDLVELVKNSDEDFINNMIKYSEENLSSEFVEKLKKISKMKDILKMI